MSSISLQVLAYKHLIYLVPLHFTHKQLENTHNVLYVLTKAQHLGTARGKTKSHDRIGIIIVSQHTTCTGSSVLFGNLSVFVFVFLAFFHFPQLSSQTFFKLLKLPAPITCHHHSQQVTLYWNTLSFLFSQHFIIWNDFIYESYLPIGM